MISKKRFDEEDGLRRSLDKIKIFLIFGAIALFVVLIYLYMGEDHNSKFICGDGTELNSCSDLKPYFCLNDTLVERASDCGCPEGFEETDDSCISQFQSTSEIISLNYVLRGEQKQIDLAVYDGVANYVSKIPRQIYYKEGETPNRGDFKESKINEKTQFDFISPLIVKIQNLDDDKTEQARIAVSLVQNLEWGVSEKPNFNFGDFEVNYSRYPYEVLYEKQGLCGEKSELLALILKELGFEVVLFYNQIENHESVGIKCPKKHSWKETGYCFVETTGPSIITDSSIEYVGGLILQSNPEIILISEGISLESNLYEYTDAETLMKIRDKKRMSYFDKKKLEKLEEKYGLAEEYFSG
ncbi:MAG: hypothetical protein WDZ77_01310 [Candidatus Pacearchaeota archaeon]